MEFDIMSMAVAAILAWFGSLEWRMRNILRSDKKKLDQQEVEHLIDLKLESLVVLQNEIRNDIKELTRKIDRLK